MLYYIYKFIRIQRREKMTKAMVYKLLEEFNGTLALKDAKKRAFLLLRSNVW